MQTVIVGAGALGTILAAHLARAGERVTLVARGPRADALENDGITITGLDEFRTKVTIARSLNNVRDVDLVVLATKTYDTAAALGGGCHPCAPTAFSVQNGVQKNTDLAAVFGAQQTIGAAANLSGEVRDQRTSFTVHGSLLIGELDGRSSDRVSAIVAMLCKSGIKARQVQNIRSVEWSKYALFSALMAPAVLCRWPTWKLASDPDVALVVARIVREIGALAQGEGVTLNDDGPLAVSAMCQSSLADAATIVRQLGNNFEANAPNHRMSVLQDLERGRHLEVEATLGFAIRKAGELGIELPTIETCYRLSSMLNRQVV